MKLRVFLLLLLLGMAMPIFVSLGLTGILGIIAIGGLDGALGLMQEGPSPPLICHWAVSSTPPPAC